MISSKIESNIQNIPINYCMFDHKKLNLIEVRHDLLFAVMDLGFSEKNYWKWDRLEYCFGGKNLENLLYYLMTVFYVSSNQEKQQSIPSHALSPTPFVEHTQKSWICLFKIRFCFLNIFPDALLFPDFFLIIDITKHSTLKPWNWFCGKRHHSCEIRCPIFTLSQLFIAGVIRGRVSFLPWLFSGQLGKSGILIHNKCACP